jgi:hypothetical protein
MIVLPQAFPSSPTHIFDVCHESYVVLTFEFIQPFGIIQAQGTLQYYSSNMYFLKYYTTGTH